MFGEEIKRLENLKEEVEALQKASESSIDEVSQRILGEVSPGATPESLKERIDFEIQARLEEITSLKESIASTRKMLHIKIPVQESCPLKSSLKGSTSPASSCNRHEGAVARFWSEIVLLLYGEEEDKDFQKEIDRLLNLGEKLLFDIDRGNFEESEHSEGERQFFADLKKATLKTTLLKKFAELLLEAIDRANEELLGRLADEAELFCERCKELLGETRRLVKEEGALFHGRLSHRDRIRGAALTVDLFKTLYTFVLEILEKKRGSFDCFKRKISKLDALCQELFLEMKDASLMRSLFDKRCDLFLRGQEFLDEDDPFLMKDKELIELGKILYKGAVGKAKRLKVLGILVRLIGIIDEPFDRFVETFNELFLKEDKWTLPDENPKFFKGLLARINLFLELTDDLCERDSFTFFRWVVEALAQMTPYESKEGFRSWVETHLAFFELLLPAEVKEFRQKLLD